MIVAFLAGIRFARSCSRPLLAVIAALLGSAIALSPPALGQQFVGDASWLTGFHSEPRSPTPTAVHAAVLEAKLAADPGNEAIRKSLLAYYEGQQTSPRRSALILWLIEHHPESRLLRSPLTAINPLTDPAAASQANALFRAQVGAHANDTRVLLNAACHLAGTEPLERIKLIERAASLDSKIKPGLALEYANVTFADATHDTRWRNYFGGDQAISYVKRQIASSNDAAIVGGAAFCLISATLGEYSPVFDYAGIRSLTIDLLVRAEALDPKNPAWPYGLNNVRMRPLDSAVSNAALNTAAQPKFIRVGGNVQKANLLYSPARTPQSMRGRVDLQIRVDETGRVIYAQVLSGPEALKEVALRLVRQYVYVPTPLNGVPVSVITTVSIAF